METINLSAIESLPWELLAKIMWHHVETDDLQELVQPGCQDRWTCLMLVCRLWRNIARRTPKLWSQIHLHWPSQTVLRFSTRGAKAPRSIGIDNAVFTSPRWPRDKISLTHILATRVDRLSIVVHDSFFSVPSSIAENLKWVCDRIFDPAHETPHLRRLNLKLQAPGLLDTVTLANLPRLSELRLHNVPITSDIPSSCSLTNVEISCSKIPFDFLAFLSGVPMLECASFIELVALKPDPISTRRSRPTIPLHHLQKLTFQWCRDVNYDAILRSITYPNSAQISLVMKTSSDDLFSEIIPECWPTLLGSCSVLYLSLLEQHTRDIIILELNSTNSAFYHIELSYTVDSRRPGILPNKGATARSERIFTDLMQDGYSLVGLRRLTLVLPSLPSSKTLTSLVKRCVDLEEIWVQTDNATALITALELPAPIVNSNSTSLQCPALRHLHLCWSKFNPYHLERMSRARRETWADVAPEMARLKVTMGFRFSRRIDGRAAIRPAREAAVENPFALYFRLTRDRGLGYR
ncbi:hypothetical protein SISNIDRAFT_502676 [Sistotremastrum niveocremeum HHB9708]|uniref:Uncharacterized protein n=1 Tax=Sistotremastrum niveocremeum HHB9708 TaxID=1314777 RepID=A0A164WEK0_9AGAM|nr:hypothetical protein SISNIDRAFT_502676 [Sistotremastrum niveocremeum HHB9708]